MSAKFWLFFTEEVAGPLYTTQHTRLFTREPVVKERAKMHRMLPFFAAPFSLWCELFFHPRAECVTPIRSERSCKETSILGLVAVPSVPGSVEACFSYTLSHLSFKNAQESAGYHAKNESSMWHIGTREPAQPGKFMQTLLRHKSAACFGKIHTC